MSTDAAGRSTRGDESLCSLITPRGRGAIAVVLLTGPHAADVCCTHFQPASGKTWSPENAGRVQFGYWQAPGLDTREEVVVWTSGDNRLEVHCHGGSAVIDWIMSHAKAMGCHEVSWEDAFWEDSLSENAQSENALRDGKPNIIAAEAHFAAIRASTERTAALLMQQAENGLWLAIKELQPLVENKDFSNLTLLLNELLMWGEFGDRLTRLWMVALCGPPNVGKSSLFNALLGIDRAIVHDMPGVTRDALHATTAFEGWPMVLVDTAGIRPTQDELEQAGMEAARTTMLQADLILCVTSPDITAANMPSDMIDQNTTPHVIILNKCDLLDDEDQILAGVIQVSATKRIGVSELQERIVEMLIPVTPKETQAIPFTERQIAWLRAAKTAAAARDREATRRCLDGILHDKHGPKSS